MRTRAGADRFRALLAAHLDDSRARRLSPSALEQASRVLPRLFTHLREDGIRDLRLVSEAELVRFARGLAERGLGAQTRATYLAAVKRFFRFLEERHVLLVNPARELSLPAVARLPRRVLSETEARALVIAPSSTVIGRRDRALLELLYGTGIRRGECVRLDLTDLDLAAATLLVRDGKGRRDRVVPVPLRAGRALERYVRDTRGSLVESPYETALFVSRFGRRLAPNVVDLVIRRHCAAAGVAPVSAHVLRHTCATHLLRGGADVRHVQELLGHKSLQTTALYTRVAIEDLRRVIARTHPRR